MAMKRHMTAAVPDAVDVEGRRYVVMANNEPVSPRHWLIAWVGVAVIWVAMFAFLYGILTSASVAVSWAWPVALGLSIFGLVRVLQWVLPALTGDLPAVREIERTADADMHRVDREAAVWGQRLDNEREAEGHRHAEEMARISAGLQAQVDSLRGEIVDLRRGLVQYSNQLQVAPALGQWVESVPEMGQDEQQALSWALSLYGEDGLPDPKKVVPGKGHIQVKVPWNSVEDWQPGATSLLVDGPNGFAPLLVKAGSSHNYKLALADYPTVQDVHNAYGTVRAEGWVG